MKIFTKLNMYLMAFILISIAVSAVEIENKVNDVMLNMDQRLQNLFNEEVPGAVVLVAKGNSVLFKKSYGLASIELGVKMHMNNVFSIGSLTKMFTSVAILRLHDEGKLSIKDDISKYLPVYSKYQYHITIENLLTHSSGIVDLFSIPEWFKDWAKDVDRDYLINLFLDKPLAFKPGSKSEYSNSNYILLGEIIEKVTGKKYFEYLQNEFFTPLEMKGVFYPDNTLIIPGCASGYLYTENPKFSNPPYVSYTHLDTAGGIFTNVDSIFIFMSNLFGDKILKKDTLDKAIRPFTNTEGEKTDYGMGCFFSEDWQTIEYGGSMLGYEVHAAYMTDYDLIIIMFTNISNDHTITNPYFPRIHVKKIIRLIRGTDDEFLKPANLEDSKKSGYVGTYKISDGDFRVISLREGKLYSTRNNYEIELFPLTDTEFFYEGSGVSRIIFNLDGSGNAISVDLINGKGQITRGTKMDDPNSES
ncbi:MAG: serine hydrolase, partial [Acidobacteria bacterium]|nr:serine hydrolase [Acidobacteriota bacterium]